MGDSYNVSGNVGQVSIKSKLEGVVVAFQSVPSLLGQQKAELETLIAQLQTALRPVMEQRPQDADRILKSIELAGGELSRDKPDKSFLKLTAKGLKQAATAVKDIAPDVLAVVGRIAKFISGL